MKPTLPIPQSWTSSLQSSETIKFCCSSHPVCDFYCGSPSKLIHLPSQLLDLTPAYLFSHIPPPPPQVLQSSHIHLLQIPQMCYVPSCLWACAQVALSTWNTYSPAHFHLEVPVSPRRFSSTLPSSVSLRPSPSQLNFHRINRFSLDIPQLLFISVLSLTQPLPQQLVPGPLQPALHTCDTTAPLLSPRCLPLTSWPKPSLMPRLEHPQKPNGHTHGPTQRHAGNVTPLGPLMDKVSPFVPCADSSDSHLLKLLRSSSGLTTGRLGSGRLQKHPMYCSFLLPCFTPLVPP